MEELRVQKWRRYGHDRLYVNRSSDGETVAWYDQKTGAMSVIDEDYRERALSVLAPYLTRARPPLATATEQGESALPVGVPLAEDTDLSLNRPGDALRRQIHRLEPNGLLRLLARYWNVSEAHRWTIGLRGERITGARLNRLGRHGWHVLHSIELPSGSDIDHIAIGPPGVFAINTKHHRGKSVWLGDHAITVNRSVTQYVHVSRSEAAQVARRLTMACGWPVEARPVIAVVGAAKLKVKSATPPVLLVDGAQADRPLFGLAPKLTSTQVSQIYAAARQGKTWH